MRRARQRIAALGGLAAFADVADDAVEGLRRYGAGLDLLLLGPHKHHAPDRLVQCSTTQRLADDPPAPLLVLAQAQAGSQGRTSRKQDDGGSPVGARSSRGEDSTGNSSFVLTHPRTIESDVRDALQRDARIKRPELIAISVDMIGTVVLGGTVATIRQRRAAAHDARRIDGVFEVIDHLRVHPPVGPLRTDDEIRAAALRRLNGDSRIHAEQIRVKLARGRVTLTGYVRHASERLHTEEAVASVDNVVDVVDVVNEIDVRSAGGAGFAQRPITSFTSRQALDHANCVMTAHPVRTDALAVKSTQDAVLMTLRSSHAPAL